MTELIEPQTVKHPFESLEQMVIDGKILFYEMMSDTEKLLGLMPGKLVNYNMRDSHREQLSLIIDKINEIGRIQLSFEELGICRHTFYYKCTDIEKGMIKTAKLNYTKNQQNK